jgi:hypothetical protein
MKGDKFLVIDLTVFQKGEETMSLMQVIGWDPRQEQVHSWLFDTRGGFGEGTWNHNKGNAWSVTAAGVTADGRRGSGTHLWRVVDDSTFTWEGIDRDVGGQLLPDVTVTYQRVKKAR